MNRRLLLLPLLLLAAFLTWRHFQPPRGEREIILGEMAAIARAARSGDVGGIVSRLDKGFRLQSASKSEIRTQLVAFFWQSSDVKLDLAGADASVEGDAATSRASYTVRWRGGPGAPEEVKSGVFEARWRKVEGAWKIVEVSGVDGSGNS